jgi:hypothetical protein
MPVQKDEQGRVPAAAKKRPQHRHSLIAAPVEQRAEKDFDEFFDYVMMFGLLIVH